MAQRESMDEMNYRCELLNETIGQADDAYFTLEQFQKNQIVRKCFVPPTIEQIINGETFSEPKKKNELRLLFVDFAWADKTSVSDNDNTVIGCMSIYQKTEKWYRKVDYMETFSGGKTAEDGLKRIRELFFDYEADYIVYDTRSGGDVLAVDLTREYIHPQRPSDQWNSHGFTICNEFDIQIASDNKLKEVMNKTIDSMAIPCLIPIAATPKSNTLMHQDLSLRLRNGEIAFLIDDLQYQQNCAEDKDYLMLSSEEKAQRRIAYIQTALLINEAVNLSAEWRGGELKLTEPRMGYKDRITALEYGNMVATKIINKLERNSSQSVEIDWNELRLVF